MIKSKLMISQACSVLLFLFPFGDRGFYNVVVIVRIIMRVSKGIITISDWCSVSAAKRV